MITVTRLESPELPEEVVKELWDYLKDDAELSKDEYTARLDDNSRWYVSGEDDEVVGVYWLRKLNHVTWEIHTNVRMKFWGTGKALPHAKTALDFIFDESGARKIVATIPETAPHVLAYAKQVGFTEEGRMTGSFLKDDILYDQIHLGITHREIK